MQIIITKIVIIIIIMGRRATVGKRITGSGWPLGACGADRPGLTPLGGSRSGGPVTPL